MRTLCPCLLLAILIGLSLLASFPNLSSAQRMWSENGQVLAEHPRWGDSDTFPTCDDGHILLVRTTSPYPWHTIGCWVELRYDEDGDFVDSLRYPPEVLESEILFWNDLPDGTRILCTYSNTDAARIHLNRIDADGNMEWRYTSPYLTEINLSFRTKLVYLDDYFVLIHNSLGVDTHIIWLNPESGETITHYMIEGLYSDVYDYRIRDDNSIDHLSVTLNEDDSTFTIRQHNLTLNDITLNETYVGQGRYLKDIWYRNGLPSLLFRHITNNVGSGDVCYMQLDEDFNFSWEEQLAELGGFVCHNYASDDVWLSLGDGSMRYQIMSADVEECYSEPVSPNFRRPDLHAFDDHRMISEVFLSNDVRMISPSGATIWTRDDIAYGNRNFFTDTRLFAYHYNAGPGSRNVYRLSNGTLVSTSAAFYDPDNTDIERYWIVNGLDGNDWIVWHLENDELEQSDYYRAARFNRSTFPADSVEQIDLDFYGSSTYYNSIFPDGNDGLLVLGLDNVHLNSDGEMLTDDPVQHDNAYYVRYKVDWVGEPDDDGLYPIIESYYEHIMGYPVHVDLTYIDQELNSIDSTISLVQTDLTVFTPMNMETCKVGNRLYFGYTINHNYFTPYAGYCDMDEGTVSFFNLSHPGGVVHYHYADPYLYAVTFHFEDELRHDEGQGPLYLEIRDMRTSEGPVEIPLVNEIHMGIHSYNPEYIDYQSFAHFEDNSFYLTCFNAEDGQWQIAEYNYFGELVAGPVDLGSEFDSPVIGLYAVEDYGFWVAMQGKVYAFDRDLNLVDGCSGLSFTDDSRYQVYNAKSLLAENNDLIVAWQFENAILTQRFSSQVFDYLAVAERTVLPAQFTLAAPWPNPFNSTTRLRYSLPHAGEVRLAVYDILGRQVRELANATQQAGQYEVHWDGCSDAGIGVASGVYFVRAELGEQQLVKKVMLVK